MSVLTDNSHITHNYVKFVSSGDELLPVTVIQTDLILDQNHQGYDAKAVESVIVSVWAYLGERPTKSAIEILPRDRHAAVTRKPETPRRR
jgi:hypothetical protein